MKLIIRKYPKPEKSTTPDWYYWRVLDHEGNVSHHGKGKDFEEAISQAQEATKCYACLMATKHIQEYQIDLI